MRRWASNMNGERYCANKITMEIHDLDRESADCGISEVIESGLDIPFTTLFEAIIRGFHSCELCLGQFELKCIIDKSQIINRLT
ncbi:hypothetical protein KAR48_19005 [bacterium]|nr:hypothetical protein [bacterium]